MLLLNNKYLHDNFLTDKVQYLQCFKQNLKIIQPWNTYLAHFWDTTKVGDVNQQYIKNKSLRAMKEFNQSMDLIDISAKTQNIKVEDFIGLQNEVLDRFSWRGICKTFFKANQKVLVPKEMEKNIQDWSQ